MQLVVAIISTVVICGLLIFGASTMLPADSNEDIGNVASANISTTLTNSITDSVVIYQASPALPDSEAGDDVINGDIAELSPD